MIEIPRTWESPTGIVHKTVIITKLVPGMLLYWQGRATIVVQFLPGIESSLVALFDPHSSYDSAIQTFEYNNYENAIFITF